MADKYDRIQMFAIAAFTALAVVCSVVRLTATVFLVGLLLATMATMVYAALGGG